MLSVSVAEYSFSDLLFMILCAKGVGGCAACGRRLLSASAERVFWISSFQFKVYCLEFRVWFPMGFQWVSNGNPLGYYWVFLGLPPFFPLFPFLEQIS